VLNVKEQNDEEIKFNVNSPFDSNITLVSQVRGEIFYSEQIFVKKGNNSIIVKTNKFPAGIAQFTLFGNKNIERCERLIFVNKNRKMRIEISTNKEQYLPREKVEMTVKTFDENDMPIPANLSLSVTDEKLVSFADDKQDNILSHLLINSDLKGKVFEPSFYFDKDEEKADQALDLLMLTNGWRHFTWSDVIEKTARELKENIKIKPENFNITGKIIHFKSGKTQKNIKVWVIETEETTQTNEKGEFILKNTSPDRYYTIRTEKKYSIIQLNAKDYKIIAKNSYGSAKRVNTLAAGNETARTISGIITEEETGDPIPGANVVVKGTTTGTITNLDGQYSIDVPANSTTLICNFVGLKTQEVAINGDEILNIALLSDTDIEEVVVTAVGVSRSEKKIGYAVTTVGENILTENRSYSMLQALQGRVAGVNITQASGAPGASTRVIIRGFSSFNGNNQPLYVIDGVPMNNNSSSNDYLRLNDDYRVTNYVSSKGRTYTMVGNHQNNSLNGGTDFGNSANDVNPEDIASMTILKGSQATALYGSRAANGVIIIVTKKGNNHGYSRYYGRYGRYTYGYGNYRNGLLSKIIKKIKEKPQPVNQIIIPENEMYRVKKFYSPTYESTETELRTDFRTTVYWNPNVNTGNKGTTKLSFYNSDEVSSFKTTVEGIAVDGNIGRQEHTFHTQLPFSMSVKVPVFLSYADVIKIPITLKNKTNQSAKGVLKFKDSEYLKLVSKFDSVQSISANSTKTVYAEFQVQNIAGKENFTISYESNGLTDAFKQEIEIMPKGFPVSQSFSGNSLSSLYKLEVEDLVENSLTAQVTVYPDVVSDLMSGVESILREPYGCFEQVSSSTYPNILALQYLRETGNSSPDIAKKAEKFIRNGYAKLLAYETRTEGFDWWGKSPGHGGLSAYGLMEFTEIKALFPDLVNDKLLSRTTEWILSKRNKKGGFKQKKADYHAFGDNNAAVNDAYITFALSESGYTKINVEAKNCYKEALKSKDFYRLALTANIHFNLKDSPKAEELMTTIKKAVNKNGFENLKSETSFVASYGNSLQIETASLILLAELKSNNPDNTFISKGIKFLLSKRGNYGGFGSTQSTILALKALTAFAKDSKKTKESGTVTVYVNGKEVATSNYKASAKGEIKFKNLGQYIQEGTTDIEVKFTNCKEALPYSIDMNWTSNTPDSNKDCRLSVKTSISKRKIRQGETVRLTAELKNIYNTSVNSPMLKIGIPAGLSLSPKLLKNMQEKQEFAYYEIKDNYLILYYRGFAKGETKTINLDLKAETPGEYLAPASCAYLYYANEYKTWVAGENILIVK